METYFGLQALPLIYLDIASIDEYNNDVIIYIAGFVTRGVVRKTVCKNCKEFLATPGEKSAFILRKQFADCTLFAVNPELEVFFKFVEKIVKPKLELKNILKKNFIEMIVIKSVSSFFTEYPELFLMLKDHEKDHRYEVAKSLSRKYVRTRVARFIKLLNTEEKEAHKRKRAQKLLHFQNV